MKLQKLLLLVCLYGAPLFAQNAGRFRYQSGFGFSYLQTGDMQAYSLENEIQYQFNRYLTAGVSGCIGRSDQRLSSNLATYGQSNTTIYLSPFRNNRKLDFRIGVGPSWYYISESNARILTSQGTIYEHVKRRSRGANSSLEFHYHGFDKIVVGLKFFHQSYRNEDINSGGMVVIGFKF
jgi:hypothetical protein